MAVMSDDFAPKLEARLAQLGITQPRPIVQAVAETLAEDPKLTAMVEMGRMARGV